MSADAHKIDINTLNTSSASTLPVDDVITPNKPTKKKGLNKTLKENLLAILTVVGVLAGVALGFGLRSRESDWKEREVMYVKFIGELFLRMLKALILPLIVSSLIAAVGGLDISLSGKIGGRAIAYYAITTVLAIVLGIVLVVLIRPGDGQTDIGLGDISDEAKRNATTADTIMDLVR